jgi:hypothetical protein
MAVELYAGGLMAEQVRISWGDGNTTYADLDAPAEHVYARHTNQDNSYRIKSQTLDGELDGSTEVAVTPLVPVLTSLAPASFPSGPAPDPPLVITVTGDKFAPNARVRFGGYWSETTFVNATTLEVRPAIGGYTGVGTVQVQVGNDPPEGPDSEKLPFEFVWWLPLSRRTR